MTVALSNTKVELVAGTAIPPIRFTDQQANLLGQTPAPHRKFSAVSAAFLGDQAAPLNHLTQVVATFLAIRAPNMKFIPMILPDVFPNDISYNSVGTIRFATDVVVVDSGDDQRVQRWDQPLLEFDVAYGVRTMEQLQEMIAFFRAMRGRLYAFNYRDWMDYTSSMAVAYEAREAPPIASTDQLQMQGDGNRYRFQLVKNYIAPTSGTTLVRPITRPDEATVSVAVIGSAPWNGDWTDHMFVDPDTGIVELLPRHTITATGVIKDDTMEAGGGIHAAPGTFNDYRDLGFAGQHARVIVSGFTNPGNNVTKSQTATIYNVSDDGGTIYLTYGQGGSSSDTAANFSISIHPAPPTGVSVFAGFEFYVPVRFDTDQLPLTLEEYGIGGAQSIKLVEVRPTAF